MSVKQIVTHNGVFHADDVFAVAVLFAMYPDAEIIRTRKPELCAPAEGRIVVDVGGVYDPAKLLFDHHQREGRKAPRDSGIPYSGFGLVWDVFGREYVELHCGSTAPESAILATVAHVDETLVSSVDVTDNGFSLTSVREGFEGCGMGLSAAISQFNPSWCERSNGDWAFEGAIRIASTLLQAVCRSAMGAALAVELVQRQLDQRADPRVLTLDQFMPWQGTATADPDVLYVVFPAETGDTWMVQCVPPTAGSFAKRKALPEKWAGVRDSALAELTGVEDAVFCHPGRFICGARSKEGALKLLELALAE